MGYHVPVAFGVAIFAYFSLVVIRPVLLGAWGHGFPYGIFSHLDWVSNVGYQYLHFHYNPAHMIAITSSSPRPSPSLHGRSCSPREPAPREHVKTAEHENTYFRDIIAGRSARSASTGSAVPGALAGFWSAVCKSLTARSGPAAGRMVGWWLNCRFWRSREVG
jgi:photosynthetic reaction center L subunit